MAVATPKRREQEPVEKPAPKLDTKRLEGQILLRIGKPDDLHKVEVFRYTPTTARINIWRAMDRDAATRWLEARHYRESDVKKEALKALHVLDGQINKTITRITDSFSLITTPEGDIVAVMEGRKAVEIARRY